MVIDFVVSEQNACVKGHFPDAPVVPGAYLLGKIDLALREAFPGRRLSGFTKVKFLAPLLPGCRALLSIEAQSETRIQVRITHQTTTLLQATALLDQLV